MTFARRCRGCGPGWSRACSRIRRRRGRRRPRRCASTGSTRCCRCSARSCASPKSRAAKPGATSTRVDLSALATELAESFALVGRGRRAHPAVVDRARRLRRGRPRAARASVHQPSRERAAAHAGRNGDPPDDRGRRRISLMSRWSITAPASPRRTCRASTKRFARLEASRNTAGYGLGLSLVDAVAKLHGGRLVLTSAAPGLSATMELPLAVRA